MTAEAAQALTSQVANRLAYVAQRLDAAGALGQAVTIVAVTKGGSVAQIEAALANGLADLGENYAAELKSKSQAAAAQGLAPQRWHFLGQLQSNKISRLADTVSVWQTLDNLKTAHKLARRVPGAAVFIEVKPRPDPSRPGVAPGEAAELVAGCQQAGLNVKGLMCLASRSNPEADFELCRQLGAQLGLAELSMGMSDDFELAVKHGATMIRLGRILFDADYRL